MQRDTAAQYKVSQTAVLGVLQSERHSLFRETIGTRNSDEEPMEQMMPEDDLCGNRPCGHARHEHKDGKRCTGFLPTERNAHGEVEAAEEE